ncbi:MAG: HNH endonuclease [Proteobacteria bacterium]|nr:HNH endonuclease [Pseudomonadota bacterium]
MKEETKAKIRNTVIDKLKAQGRYTGEFVKTEKTCEKCGKSFKPIRSSQKCCSHICAGLAPDPVKKAKKAVEAVSRRRKKVKQMAVNELGGACVLCGYDRCIEALEFHHKDPDLKDFTISAKGHCRAWESIKAELNKCVLVCSNCHRELHAGIKTINR